MTHGKTYNTSARRISHKATKSKTNTVTTALERSVEQTTGGFKHFYSLQLKKKKKKKKKKKTYWPYQGDASAMVYLYFHCFVLHVCPGKFLFWIAVWPVLGNKTIRFASCL